MYVCLGVRRGLGRVLIKYSGNVRLQRKYFPPYDETYSTLISLDGFRTAGRNVREIIKILAICNFNSIFIMLFHVLWKVNNSAKSSKWQNSIF